MDVHLNVYTAQQRTAVYLQQATIPRIQSTFQGKNWRGSLINIGPSLILDYFPEIPWLWSLSQVTNQEVRKLSLKYPCPAGETAQDLYLVPQNIYLSMRSSGKNQVSEEEKNKSKPKDWHLDDISRFQRFLHKPKWGCVLQKTYSKNVRGSSISCIELAVGIHFREIFTLLWSESRMLSFCSRIIPPSHRLILLEVVCRIQAVG